MDLKKQTVLKTIENKAYLYTIRPKTKKTVMDKRIFTFLMMGMAACAVFMSCSKDDDDSNDNPKDEEIVNSGSNQGGGYDPNSDHALSLCLKEKGYGSITTCNFQTAIVGSWFPVSYCAMYYSILEDNKGCDDYDGGYKFNSDGLCCYLDVYGNMEGGWHSWSIENNEMLRVHWTGTADDRVYLKMTTKGYLIMNWHGSPCWKIYKKS